ncbi:MAG: RidA family protein [Bacteroidales bacterium]
MRMVNLANECTFAGKPGKIMQQRMNIFSGTSWETKVGYARAVRMGNIIEVSGTTAMDGDVLIGGNSAYLQSRFIFQKIEKALKEAGGSLNEVVRTRMYVTDIDLWEEIARAHEEVFREVRPAATMVEVSRLISPDLLVEIEVTAILPA